MAPANTVMMLSLLLCLAIGANGAMLHPIEDMMHNAPVDASGLQSIDIDATTEMVPKPFAGGRRLHWSTSDFWGSLKKNHNDGKSYFMHGDWNCDKNGQKYWKCWRYTEQRSEPVHRRRSPKSGKPGKSGNARRGSQGGRRGRAGKSEERGNSGEPRKADKTGKSVPMTYTSAPMRKETPPTTTEYTPVPAYTPKDAPTDMPEDAPEYPPEDLPEDAPQDMREDMPEDVPEDVPEPSPNRSPDAGTGGSCGNAMVQDMIAATNNERAAEGMRGLSCNEPGSQASMQWSEELCQRGGLAHDLDTNGGAAGFGAMAENVLQNNDMETTVEVGIKQWIESPGHYKNIMGDYSEIGCGYATCDNGGGMEGEVFWTCVYGTPK